MNVKTLPSLYDPLSAHCTKESADGFNSPLNSLPLNACHYSHQFSQQLFSLTYVVWIQP